MIYETVMNNIKTGHTATIAHINEVVDQLLESYEDEEEQSWERLDELMGALTTSDIQTYNGDSNQYHNLAVSFARANQYGFACDVIKIGLDHYSESQDLLADFLAYASKCGRMDEAQACYDKLMNMDRASLNWRAFDFSIDYLSAKLLKTSDKAEQQKINDRIDELLSEYQSYHSDDEKAYLAQYLVSDSRNEKDAINVLQEKIAQKEFSAPRCTLKLAEHLFKTGRYEEAEKYIEKGKRWVTSSEVAVEPGSFYTLAALCGICRIYEDGIENLRNMAAENDEKNELEKRVRSVYKDCEAAEAIYLKHRFREYKELEVQRNVLDKLSEIPYGED